nr:hypothetical protein [Tanacetum cinerariifolium]
MSTPTFAGTHNLVVFLEKPAESAGFKVNDQEQIQALVDKQKIIIMEDIIRSDLRFDDAEGTACLFNEAIFEGLAHMRAKTTAWNEFSSTMASTIICLANNQKFNFSKYIVDNMVKGLEGGIKFYLFPRFLQIFLDKQVEGMARHKEMYIISSHTKKIFANMRRIGAGFSRVITHLFDTMIVQAAADMGDTPEAEVSHDESEDKDHVPTPFSDPLCSCEDSYILNELMVFCTSLQEQVFDLQEDKDTQSKEITALKKKVSKLLKWKKSRSRGLRRLMKISSGRRVKSPLEKDSLGAQEDTSKHGRMIEEIDQDDEIALDADTQGRKNNDEMFAVDGLSGEDVVLDTTTALAVLKSTKPKVMVQEQEVSTTILVAATKVTTAVPTPRAKGIVFHKEKQSYIPTVSSSKDKGKAKMIEPEVLIKKKGQMRMDEELQVREREEFSKVQKARLLVELIEKKEETLCNFESSRKEKQTTHKSTNEKSNMYLSKKYSGKEAQESSTKRTAECLESDISKKQKVDENVKAVINDTKELKKCMEIVPNDGDEEGKKTYFKIIRADSNSQVDQTFEKMFKNFNREDLEVLWGIAKDRFKKEKLVDDMDNLMFKTLKTMFEHHVEDVIWIYQQGLAKVKNWKLYESCRVDDDAEMAYDLLGFIRKQIMEGYIPQ